MPRSAPIIHAIALASLLAVAARPCMAANRLPLPASVLCPQEFRAILSHSRRSRLPAEKRFRKGGIIIDTNIAAALERLQGNDGSQERYRESIRALASYLNVPEKDLLSRTRHDGPFYYPRAVVGELLPDREWRKNGEFLRGSAILRGRSSPLDPEFRRIMDTLQTARVGGRNGGADRKIIAEVLLADTERGTLPTFVTADRGIYVKLCHLSPECRDRIGSLPVERAFPQGFEVRVGGRSMRLVPIPTAGP